MKESPCIVRGKYADLAKSSLDPNRLGTRAMSMSSTLLTTLKV